MLTKGQVRVVPADDVPAQRAFVHRVFGVAAYRGDALRQLAYGQSTQQIQPVH
jgi:hypothetical protein